MKKTLALVLALAMVFSTITVAFAEGTIGADAQVCADLGMLKGATGTVDAAYVATVPNRAQAAVMFLRLKGLEAEAMAFTGEANFADADEVAWAKPVMAYLKANPQLGWVGSEGKFNPAGVMTAQAYYKVMLETLGYKQTTAEVVGDFAYADVVTFAAGKGLTKVAAVTNFTVNDLATATVEALKANMKDGGKTLVATLVEAGKVDNAKAVAAGLIVEEAPVVAVAVDSAIALGSTVVEVEFEEDFDAASAGDAANYVIEGLEIKSVVVAGADTVRLETATQTAGKLYTLTVGEKSVTFAGLEKVSGGPELTDAVSEDVEEVVLTFDMNLDYAAATDVANYTISGVDVVEAAVDGEEVTLTTEGLKNKTSYTVKVSNMKSIEGTSRRATSESFKSNFDTAAPRIDQDVLNSYPDTNQRIILTFNEEVTQESAEDLANYAIEDEDGAELAIVSVTWDDDDEDNVEIVTEAMVKNEEYKLSVNNIADQRKVANVMTKASSFNFDGLEEDEDAPEIESTKVLSPTLVRVTFKDESRVDEDSALDTNNYTLENSDEYIDVESIETLKNETGTFVALLTVSEMETNGNYTLEVVDVLDEFGNAMKEKTEGVDADLIEFASSTLVSITVVNKTTIVLDFNEELDETSAENIANYSIDGDIGTPTKAEYEKTGDADDSVRLTLNEMINGKEYEIAIDGVTDLAGNVLNFDKEFDAITAQDWDEDAPELESVDLVDKYVVALQFDEEVSFEDGTELWLLQNDNTTIVKLDAMTTAEDDKVVEFSKTASVTLTTDDVTYSVYKIVYNTDEFGAIVDLIGNKFEEIEDYDDMLSFKNTTTTDNPEYAEVDKIDQINGGQFDMTMTKNVLLVDNGTSVVLAADGSDSDTLPDYATVSTTKGSFKVTVDDDVVTFELAGGLKEDDEYIFDIREFLTDEHGLTVVNDEVDTNPVVNRTVLTGEETDTKAPYIEDVVAVDRITIDIEFSEDIKAAIASNFEVWNVDLKEEADIEDIEIDGNIVTLTIDEDEALEARYEYELKMADLVVEDFASKKAADDSYVFDGSDLSHVVTAD